MASTPKRAVRWGVDAQHQLSPMDSPLFNGTYDGDTSGASSAWAGANLEFLNAQLVAHGFVPSPGLSLDGLDGAESTRVMKCFLALLNQRMDDMGRTEDLSAKLKTLSYDMERMRSLQRSAEEKVAVAEREMHFHKSKLAASLKTLQTAEGAHKVTSTELQKTRSILQGLRSTSAIELKKKEKEVERVLERWQKLVDAQAKVALTPTGMICSNALVVEGNGGASGKGKGKGKAKVEDDKDGLLEKALAQSEESRRHLADDNMCLRMMFVKAVNEIYAVAHEVQGMASQHSPADQEPPSFTETSLFPINPPDHAGDTLFRGVQSLRQSLAELGRAKEEVNLALTRSTNASTQEVEQLQGVVVSLKEELARATQHAMDRVSETRAMFDKFAKDHWEAGPKRGRDRAQDRKMDVDQDGETSIELISAPAQDEERKRLEEIRAELDKERERFTAAAIAFGKDKAALEAERIALLDEKRSWQVEKMLSELPPTPKPAPPPKVPVKVINPTLSPEPAPAPGPMRVRKPSTSASPAHRKTGAKASPYQSPRRAVGKANRTKPKPSSRSTSTSASTSASTAGPSSMSGKVTLGEPKSRRVVSYETEVVSSVPEEEFQVDTNSGRQGSRSSLLPTSFTLPPPSPYASLPTGPALPLAQPLPHPHLASKSQSQPQSQSAPPIMSAPAAVVTNNKRTFQFPVAKPLVPNMIHAYSPARPSPLRAMAVLTASASSVGSSQLGVGGDGSPTGHVQGATGGSGGFFSSLGFDCDIPSLSDHIPPMTPIPSKMRRDATPEEEMSLAAQLGIPDSPPQSDSLVSGESKSSGNSGKGKALGRVGGRGTGAAAGRGAKTRTTTAPSADARRAGVGASKEKDQGPGRVAVRKEKENGKSTSATGTGVTSSAAATTTTASAEAQRTATDGPAGKKAAASSTPAGGAVMDGPGIQRTRVSTRIQSATTTTTGAAAAAGTTSGPKRVLVNGTQPPGKKAKR